MDRRTFLHASAPVAAAALAGCLDGGGGPSDGYGDWLADARGDATPVDRTGRETATVLVGAGGSGFAFDPAAVEVSPGTTVAWEWTGEGGRHNVVQQGRGFESAFATSAGHTFEHAFDEPGVYRYYCRPHRSLGMKGAVRVVE